MSTPLPSIQNQCELFGEAVYSDSALCESCFDHNPVNTIVTHFDLCKVVHTFSAREHPYQSTSPIIRLQACHAMFLCIEQYKYESTQIFLQVQIKPEPV